MRPPFFSHFIPSFRSREDGRRKSTYAQCGGIRQPSRIPFCLPVIQRILPAIRAPNGSSFSTVYPRCYVVTAFALRHGRVFVPFVLRGASDSLRAPPCAHRSRSLPTGGPRGLRDHEDDRSIVKATGEGCREEDSVIFLVARDAESRGPSVKNRSRTVKSDRRVDPERPIGPEALANQ